MRFQANLRYVRIGMFADILALLSIPLELLVTTNPTAPYSQKHN